MRIILMVLMMGVASTNYIDKLRSEAKANNQDSIVLFYYVMGACVKCDMEPDEIVSRLAKTRMKNVKIGALVHCDREIELKVFLKNYHWKYAAMMDDGTSREKLGAPSNAFVTVIRPDNKTLSLEANYSSLDNLESDWEKISNFIDLKQIYRDSISVEKFPSQFGDWEGDDFQTGDSEVDGFQYGDWEGDKSI